MAASDALPIPIKNQAFRLYIDVRTAAGALVTSWTGMDSEISKDGGSFADCTAEATEIGTSGVGYIDLTATEMNADSVVYKLTLTNTGAVPVVLYLYPAVSTGLEIPVDAQAIAGGTTKTGYLDAAISSRLAAASYTAPDNATIASIYGQTDVATSTRAPASTALSTAQWTNTRAALLDALTLLDVAVSTRAVKGSTVSVSSPTAQNGDFRTVQGRDYSPVIDTAIIWTLTNPPGITPTTVTFTCSDLEFSKACSYSSPTITLTLTAAELAALSTGVYSFNVEALISGLRHPGLLSGMWTIERDV